MEMGGSTLCFNSIYLKFQNVSLVAIQLRSAQRRLNAFSNLFLNGFIDALKKKQQQDSKMLKTNSD